jgi:aspartate ammonia-lyase
VMMPYVAYAVLESLGILERAVSTFDEQCVRVIKPHPERCAEFAERTVGLAAFLNEERGFMGAAEVAMKAVDRGQTIPEVVAEENQTAVRS